MRELVRSPEFFEHIARLGQVGRNEQARREQFYRTLREEARAEFINGRAVLHAPASNPHQRSVFFAANLLGEFAHGQGLGEVYSEACLIRCQRNDYAPDVCFFGPAKCANLARNQRVFPAPDLVVEVVSPATELIDRTLKLADYARHGIAEYWIIDPHVRTVEQYVLPWGREEYALRGRLAEGWLLTSTVPPDLIVPVRALFDLREYQRVLHGLSRLPVGNARA